MPQTDFTVASSSSILADHVVIVRKALGVSSLDDIDGASVLLIPGSSSEQALEAHFSNKGMNYDAIPASSPLEVVNRYLSDNYLSGGDADVMILQRSDLTNVLVDQLANATWYDPVVGGGMERNWGNKDLVFCT